MNTPNVKLRPKDPFISNLNRNLSSIDGGLTVTVNPKEEVRRPYWQPSKAQFAAYLVREVELPEHNSKVHGRSNSDLKVSLHSSATLAALRSLRV